MRLIEFKCDAFRALSEVDFQPCPGINVVSGSNAQGKTTLLEAILFAATSRSHRTNTESELVRHGEDHFRLLAHVARREREVTVEAHWWQGAKRFRVNGVAVTRVSDILGKFHVVMFCPEDIGLVKGSASGRRRFLDMELSQLYPEYLHALQQYRQALRQRNELLKHDSPKPDLLDVYDEQLATHGVVLIRERSAFLSSLANLAAEAYGRIADMEKLEIVFRPDVADPSALADTLARSRLSDIRRNMTMRGPHRDDFDFSITGANARTFASQGQQKCAAIALKLAETALIRERTGEYPILMLDEVLAELDSTRARQLFESMPPPMQCIITTTHAPGAMPFSALAHACFRILHGKLETVAR
jgi:DNA replication and repair protein RecF